MRCLRKLARRRPRAKCMAAITAAAAAAAAEVARRAHALIAICGRRSLIHVERAARACVCARAELSLALVSSSSWPPPKLPLQRRCRSSIKSTPSARAHQAIKQRARPRSRRGRCRCGGPRRARFLSNMIRICLCQWRDAQCARAHQPRAVHWPSRCVDQQRARARVFLGKSFGAAAAAAAAAFAGPLIEQKASPCDAQANGVSFVASAFVVVVESVLVAISDAQHRLRAPSLLGQCGISMPHLLRARARKTLKKMAPHKVAISGRCAHKVANCARNNMSTNAIRAHASRSSGCLTHCDPLDTFAASRCV